MDAPHKRSRLRTWLRRLVLTGGCAVAALLAPIADEETDSSREKPVEKEESANA